MNEPIRVLHVLTAMNFAGTETLLMNIYRNIDRSKIQFDFAVTANHECAYDAEIRKLGGKIIHYPLYHGINHFSYVSWWTHFFKNHPEYYIVHGHIGSTAALYLHIANKFGRFTIAHSHSTSSHRINLHDLLYCVFSFPTRYIADFFMGCSRDALIDRYGQSILNHRNHFILNNGIDAKKYVFSQETREEIRKELHIPKNEIIIGTVGRLTPPKNPLFIIQIIKELINRKIKFQFLWVGIGEEETEIRKALSYELKNRSVIMTGARADVNRVLQAMDIFIFPSLWEGLGIAGIEAQAADLPTLCSQGLPKELSVTDRCCFLPMNDLDRWVQKIIEIVKNGEYELRESRYKEIKANKYDIVDTAQWLQTFYLTQVRNRK
jgi:glycosyltransferase involved in cell wall biosynthesis